MSVEDIVKTSEKFRDFTSKKVHDAFFKYQFSQIKNAEEILRYTLAKDIFDSIDFEHLRVGQETYVEPELSHLQSDLLFESLDQEVMIYFLFEHKSYYDPQTPMQLYRYMGKIWDKFHQNYPKEEYPLIVPIVFYHGTARWDKEKTNIFNLLKTKDSRKKIYVPEVGYHLFNLNQLSPKLLEFSVEMRYILAIMRYRANQKELQLWIRQCLQYFEHNLSDFLAFYYYLLNGTELTREILIHVMRDENMGLKKINIDDLIEGSGLWLEMKEKYETGLKDGIEQGRVQGIEQGRVQGIEQGRVQGIEQGRVQGIEIHSIKLAIKLLNEKTDQQIAELTELPIERIKQLRTENTSK